MQVDHHEIGPVDVLALSGRRAGLREAADLGARFDELLGSTRPWILLDLSGLARVDSGFLGQLLVCRDRTARRGGRLKLVATGVTRDVLEMSGLDTVFDVFGESSDAIRSFDEDD